MRSGRNRLDAFLLAIPVEEISRDNARTAGLKRFFTGIPCRNGHISERIVSTGQCVECDRAWARNNRNKRRETERRYRDSHPGYNAAKAMRDYYKNPERYAANGRRWRAANPERARENLKRWKKENIEHSRAYHREYYFHWNAKNKQKIAEYQRRYHQKEIPLLVNALRSRVHMAFKCKGIKKTGSAIRDLGCTVVELMLHLERLFKPGMTWENRGIAWEIDHTKPISGFDLADREQFLAACHYTNLQPLFIADHRAKTKLQRATV